MSKELKKLIVDELVADYNDMDNFVMVSFKGVNAHQANALRRNLSEKDISFKVVKNSLASIAFNKIGVSAFEQMFKGQTAVSANKNDPVLLAKTLTEKSKELSDFKIVGGLAEGKVLSIDDVNTLASIPSREVVLTQILFGINAPLIQLANVFNAVINKLYLVLVAVKDKKE